MIFEMRPSLDRVGLLDHEDVAHALADLFEIWYGPMTSCSGFFGCGCDTADAMPRLALNDAL